MTEHHAHTANRSEYIYDKDGTGQRSLIVLQMCYCGGVRTINMVTKDVGPWLGSLIDD